MAAEVDAEAHRQLSYHAGNFRIEKALPVSLMIFKRKSNHGTVTDALDKPVPKAEPIDTIAQTLGHRDSN